MRQLHRKKGGSTLANLPENQTTRICVPGTNPGRFIQLGGPPVAPASAPGARRSSARSPKARPTPRAAARPWPRGWSPGKIGGQMARKSWENLGKLTENLGKVPEFRQNEWRCQQKMFWQSLEGAFWPLNLVTKHKRVSFYVKPHPNATGV